MSDVIRKICNRCGVEKDITSFASQKQKGVTYRKPYCNTCVSRRYRELHPDRVKNNQRSFTRKYRLNKLELKQKLLEHINQLVCKRCSYPDIRALSFHHRDPEQKSFGIAQGFTHNYGFEKMKKEVEKCDVLCMNCHTIEHCADTNAQQDLSQMAVRA